MMVIDINIPFEAEVTSENSNVNNPKTRSTPKNMSGPVFSSANLSHANLSFQSGSDVAGWFVFGLQIASGSCKKLPISQPFVLRPEGQHRSFKDELW